MFDRPKKGSSLGNRFTETQQINENLDHIVSRKQLIDEKNWTYSQGTKSSERDLLSNIMKNGTKEKNFTAQGIKIKP